MPPSMQEICRHVLLDRYAAPGERTTSQIYRRVAHALSQMEKPGLRTRIEERFRQNMEWGAIGAGRIMANAGAARIGTMINCFVHPIDIGPGKYQFETGLRQARATLALGGGVGYNFSSLPPRKAAADARAHCPAVCDAIDRYDLASREMLFEGSRRGAQIAVLDCNHPDLLEFARAKQGRKRWSTFNISIAVTDTFLQAVVDDRPWPLTHDAVPDAETIAAGACRLGNGSWCYQVESARTIWNVVTAQALDSAEPGLLYIDTINSVNNLKVIETIAATNPCGEQPLPPFGSCVLGPINLTRLVLHPFGLGSAPVFDYKKLAIMVRLQVRLLDNVLDITRWPLAAHEYEAKAKRRIGVGITGLADTLAMLQLRYDSEAGRDTGRAIACCIRDHAYAASVALAAERGPFPLYRPEAYLGPGCVGESLPEKVRLSMGVHGLRNSHLLSFAPTGSVSLAFGDNCSNGIEPAFDWAYSRRVRLQQQEPIIMHAENHAWRLWRHLQGDTPLPAYFQNGAAVAPENHVAMLAALQPYVDASISKTVPVPGNYPLDRAQALFLQAWRCGLKGLTLFRPDPRLGAVMQTTEDACSLSEPYTCTNCA